MAIDLQVGQDSIKENVLDIWDRYLYKPDALLFTFSHNHHHQSTEGLILTALIITLRVSHRRCKMYSGHLCVCVCVCVFLAAFPHYCTDPDVSWGNGRECPLVVHYWADLQLLHGFRYFTMTQRRTRNVSEYLCSLYAWFCSISHVHLIFLMTASLTQKINITT